MSEHVLHWRQEVAGAVTLVMNVRLGGVDGGWSGMLMDPARDGSHQINKGVKAARELLLNITRLGLPAACEFGDTITPQFFADLLAFASVSAQSATLRELVSPAPRAATRRHAPSRALTRRCR